jgi:hypothetical protein
MKTAGTKRRPLIPREHGAYGQLILPLVAALAMGRPTLASICMVVAAFAAFFAHEPLLVLLGKRGTRAKREQRGRAIRNGLGWMGVALASGMGGLWLGGEPVIRASLVPLGFALAMTPVILRGYEKTLVGEIGAAAALTAAAIPVAVAVGLTLDRALLVWAAWVIAFTTSTSAVRWVISAHKGQRAHDGLVTAFIATSAAAALTTQSWIFLAASPYLLASWILIARPPSTRHIRRVGWTLIFSGVLTASAAIALVRIG